jgi:hypothetical protein
MKEHMTKKSVALITGAKKGTWKDVVRKLGGLVMPVFLSSRERKPKFSPLPDGNNS